jgi:alpha-glucuronidase
MRHACARLAAALVLPFLLGAFAAAPVHAADEDGYDLWLRYRPLPVQQRRALQAGAADIVVAAQDTPTVHAAVAELRRGLAGLQRATCGASSARWATKATWCGAPASATRP